MLGALRMPYLATLDRSTSRRSVSIIAAIVVYGLGLEPPRLAPLCSLVRWCIRRRDHCIRGVSGQPVSEITRGPYWGIPQ